MQAMERAVFMMRELVITRSDIVSLPYYPTTDNGARSLLNSDSRLRRGIVLLHRAVAKMRPAVKQPGGPAGESRRHQYPHPQSRARGGAGGGERDVDRGVQGAAQ